jgi:ZIP family zinc transporter
LTWLVGILPFTSTLLGGLAVFRLRHRLHIFMALAAGILVATALTDLIPESIGLIGGENPALTAGIAAVIGYLIYSAVEAFIHQGTYEHEHPEGVDPSQPHEHDQPHLSHAQSTLGWIGPAGLIVHSTLDGVAIGLGFAASADVGLIVLFAVLVHDFADGLNVVTLAFAGGRSRRAALALLAADAAAPVVGIVIGQSIPLVPQNLGILLGVFGGAFIAIGAGHLLPEAQHHERALSLVVLTVVGATIVVVLRMFIS